MNHKDKRGPTAPHLACVAQDLRQVDAQLLRMYLRDHGVEVSIPGLSDRQTLSDLLGSHIPLRVLVQHDDQARARELVASWHQARIAPTKPEEELGDDEDLLSITSQGEEAHLARQNRDAAIDRLAYANSAVALALSVLLPIGIADAYLGRYGRAFLVLATQIFILSLCLTNLASGLVVFGISTIYQSTRTMQSIREARQAVARRRTGGNGGPYRDMYGKRPPSRAP